MGGDGYIRFTEELEQIYRAAPVGLCLLDAELRYIRINDHLAAINGKPAAEHIGRTMREMIPEIADFFEPIYRKVFATGEPVIELEMRGVTALLPRVERPYLVSIYPVLRSGRTVGASTIVQDVSEQVFVQRKLRHGDQILGQVHDAVVTTDMQGVVQSWNAAAERIYGYPASEVIGRHIRFLHLPEDSSPGYEKITQPLLTRGSHEIMVRRRTRDGRIIDVALRLCLVEDESGKPMGMIGCSNDVTEKRRLQDELVRVSTAAQRRIGQELHDVTGQELTGLRYLARTLVRSLRVTGRDVELAVRIEEGLSHALAQVREMSRGLVPVEVDAEGLMEALAALAKNVDGINDVRCAFRYDEPTVLRDTEVATQLYRIAQEGVTNAMKHAAASRIDIGLLRRDRVIELSVADDGIGLQSPAPTSGLGLRIMAHRAEMIGAFFELQSPARGTRLVCTLPVGG